MTERTYKKDLEVINLVSDTSSLDSIILSDVVDINKYAIHTYTHGPVTGSGPSVSLVPSLVWL